jgi:hypothetical protein
MSLGLCVRQSWKNAAALLMGPAFLLEIDRFVQLGRPPTI